MNGKKIKNTEPFGVNTFDTNDLVSKAFVDNEINKIDLSPYLKKDGSVAMSGNLNMNSNKIINLQPFVEEASNDQRNNVINFGYFKDQRGNIVSQINQVANNALNRKNPNVMEDNIDMGDHSILRLKDPIYKTDAVNFKTLDPYTSKVDLNKSLEKYYTSDVLDNIFSQRDAINEFKFIMDGGLFKTDEDDITLIGKVNKDFYPANPTTYQFQIVSSTSSFDTLLTIDLRSIESGLYTIVCEVFFSSNVYPSTVLLKSRSDTLSNLKDNFSYNTYLKKARSVTNFTKTGDIGKIIDLDYIVKFNKVDNSNENIFVVVHGLEGTFPEVLDDIWSFGRAISSKSLFIISDLDINNFSLKNIKNIIFDSNLDSNITNLKKIEFSVGSSITNLKKIEFSVGSSIKNLDDPIDNKDAANKQFVINSIKNNSFISYIYCNKSDHNDDHLPQFSNSNVLMSRNISVSQRNNKTSINFSKVGVYQVVYKDFYKSNKAFTLEFRSYNSNSTDMIEKYVTSGSWGSIVLSGLIKIDSSSSYYFHSSNRFLQLHGVDFCSLMIIKID